MCVCVHGICLFARAAALGTGDSPRGTIVLIVALDIFYAVKLTQKDPRICTSVRVCECVERY